MDSITELYKDLDNSDKKALIKYAKKLERKSKSQDEMDSKFTTFKNFQLYDYQKKSVIMMEKYEKGKVRKISDNTYQYTTCGIFTNPVGSGKTFCMLELISRNKMKFSKKIRKIVKTDINGYTLEKCKRKSTIIDSTLIILPHGTVLQQWKESLKYYDDLKYKVIEGKNTNFSFDNISNENIAKKMGKYDVIIISSTFYNKFNDLYKMYNEEVTWKRIIIDEVDSIRIPAMREIDAIFYWYVTATYEKVYSMKHNGFLRDRFKSMSRYGDYQDLKHKIVNFSDEYKTVLESMNVKRFRYECIPPINMYGFGNLYNNGIISRNVMDLINANDFEQAINLLGGTIHNKDNISDIIGSRILMEIEKYHNNIKAINDNFETTKLYFFATYSNAQKTRVIKEKDDRIKNHMNKITMKESQLKFIESNINDTDDCAICCDKRIEPVVINCSHIFCFKCIIGWIHMRERDGNDATCPNCREKIEKNLIVKIGDDDDEKKEPEHNEKLGKDDMILKIINKNPNGKFLIFSSSHKSFQFLEKNVRKAKILKGNPNTMNKTIKDFEQGHINVLMLNSEYNGAGINLQMATDVIIYNRLEKCLEKQVIGRALRLGRKEKFPLKIHSLYYPHEG